MEVSYDSLSSRDLDGSSALHCFDIILLYHLLSRLVDGEIDWSLSKFCVDASDHSGYAWCTVSRARRRMCHVDTNDHGVSVSNDPKFVIWEHAIDPSSLQVHLEYEIGTVVLIFAKKKNFFPCPRTQTVCVPCLMSPSCLV